MPDYRPYATPFYAAISRRRFVTGLTLGGVAAGIGLRAPSAFAQAYSEKATNVLTGTQFELSIGPQLVNFTGQKRIATTINGQLPAPVLRWREGDLVTLKVTNRLPESTSIHWHGILLPYQMDGVPGISFDGIAPGQTFTYRFKVKQSGTFWYHSHSGFQEQTGLYGAIVIEPRDPDPVAYDRDYVVLLSDWSDEDPNRIYAKLKKMSHYYNFNERTTSELWREVKAKGVAQTWQERAMWNRMRMSDRDLSDVTGYTYTFLMNGQTPADGWVGLFQRGEKVRLRFINSAAMTFFDVRIPGLKMTVVAADGQNIQPVTVDEFRIGVAETYDVIVEPHGDSAYTLFAQAIDRTGYARGTLTPNASLRAPVPDLDPLPILSHADMGMAMAGHQMHDMDQGAMHKPGHRMPGMDHDAMSKPEHQVPGMDHGAMHKPKYQMPGMDHGAMGKPGHRMPGMDQGAMHKPGHQMPGMDHRAMHKPGHQVPDMDHGAMSQPAAISHAPTEYGPHVDMRAENPQYRLDDPGVGLRHNGRRVLTYADLFNLYPTPDRRNAGREIELHLTGNMGRYMWSINGVKFADSEPLELKYGERVRVTLVNDTMMNHPMHLHGMWSDLETGDARHIPRKHTVIIQPGAKISFLVTAEALGGWAFHCHLIYHMPGMFRKVVVS